MGTRQKIKKEEAWIRSLINEHKNQENDAATLAWKRMIDYFLTNDFLEGNNHVAIITYIYTTRHYVNETFYCFAWKNFIGERTLYRYRKKYILCFKHYYSEEQEKQGL